MRWLLPSLSPSQYYDDTFPSMKEQMVFEKNVFNKTSRTESKARPSSPKALG